VIFEENVKVVVDLNPLGAILCGTGLRAESEARRVEKLLSDLILLHLGYWKSVDQPVLRIRLGDTLGEEGGGGLVEVGGTEVLAGDVLKHVDLARSTVVSFCHQRLATGARAHLERAVPETIAEEGAS
jgi:hypothetical protein